MFVEHRASQWKNIGRGIQEKSHLVISSITLPLDKKIILIDRSSASLELEDNRLRGPFDYYSLDEVENLADPKYIENIKIIVGYKIYLARIGLENRYKTDKLVGIPKMNGIYMTKRSPDSCKKETCQQKKTDIIDFGDRTIYMGRCIKHSENSHTTYTGMDSESGKFVIISEWNVQIKSKNEFLIRKFDKIKEELNNLQRLRKPNLGDYYGMKYITNGGKMTIYLLKEFIFGSNCYNLIINQNIKTDIKFLKHIAKGVLEALDYLHKNDIVHGYLKGSFVYVNDLGEVKISNHSIHRRLMDLPSVGDDKYSKEADIFRLGILLLSLAKGQHVSRKEYEIPQSMEPNLREFLAKCLSKDENDRYTTTQLLNHNFLQEEAISLLPRDYQNEKTNIPKNTSLGVIQNDQQLSLLSIPSRQSRIENDFEILEDLGKGGFGDVKKYKNKLDEGYYAIKIIQLDPNNKPLYKKIKREVQLLSRLKHENVVRYYNSWIETTTIKKDPSVTPGFPEKGSVGEIEISVTYVSERCSAEQLSVDDDEDVEFAPIMEEEEEEEEESDSCDIEFDDDLVASRNAGSNPSYIEHLYIQMEFCENNTLRTVIDNNLYSNRTRLNRLFREIVEGLAHIHKEGVIHRDLKPENIFLDCDDHVKIGDFGLATSMKSNQNENPILGYSLESVNGVSVDGSGTGVVGTALYHAPEINSSIAVIRYNEKSDIYSLGIILFEMCYRPLKTLMEKIVILTRLRQKEVIFPDDFFMRNKKLRSLISLLLNHDISKRPDSEKLLRSKLMPRQVPIDKLKELVHNTLLTSPRFEGYKFIITSCFQQPVRAIQDFTYDKGITIDSMTVPSQLDYVKEICQRIFKRHGGQNLATPILMPRSEFYDYVDSCVKLMTQSGNIVSLRYDLRYPFARFVASKNITSLRRYSIEKVFRDGKNNKPREMYEGAFDIVSPSKGALIYDAEVIYMICEILHEIPDIKNEQFVIEINHTMLLKAIFLHYDISEDKHSELTALISEVKSGKVPEWKFRKYLITSGLSETMISSFLSIFSQTDCNTASDYLRFRTMSQEVVQLASKALRDLNKIIHGAKAFGVKYHIEISPGLVHNANQYSGMMFQFVCKSKSKGTFLNTGVLASGGRYDSMIASQRSTNKWIKGSQQFAVGVSISLTRLVQKIQDKQPQGISPKNYVDVLVHSIGDQKLNRREYEIMGILWTEGIRSILIEGVNMKETKKLIETSEVTYEVILNNNGSDEVIIHKSNEERFQRTSVTTTELLHILEKTRNNNNYNLSLRK